MRPKLPVQHWLELASAESKEGKSLSFEDFARDVLAKQFRAIKSRERGARSGKDIEDLHKMRVAVRRMRAALGLFRDEIDLAWRELRKEYGWLGQILGRARDADVLSQRVQELGKGIAGLPKVQKALWKRRSVIRAQMAFELETDRYRSLQSKSALLLQGEPMCHSKAAGPAESAFQQRIERQRKKFEKAAARLDEKSKPSERHSVRILAKKYRYALEFGETVASISQKDLIQKLSKLQDGLGAEQDSAVAIDTLDCLGLDGPALEELKSRFAKMAREEAQSASKLLDDLLRSQ